MLFLPLNISPDPRQRPSAETHNAITNLPFQDFVICDVMIDVMGTGALQFPDPITEKQRGRDANRKVQMIFRPADFINENARGFATSMNEIMLKPILDLRREDRLIVLGMPGEMQINLVIRMDRHATCPFRNQIGPARQARALAIMGGYERTAAIRCQAP